MNPLLILLQPSRLKFVVGNSSDLARKGFLAVQSQILTGKETPEWLVGETDTLPEALREVEKITEQLTQATPCHFVVELHLWSGAKGEEAKWS